MKPKFVSNLPQDLIKEKLSNPDEAKKVAGQFEEEISATGQESEKEGTKAVKEVLEEREKLSQEEEWDRIENLQKKLKFKFTDYKQLLASYWDQMARAEEFPAGWSYHIVIDDKGIVMLLKAPHNEIYARAIKPCGVPKMDLVAIYKVLESSWVAINNYGGIVLPNGTTGK
jgi:hypothetical protein